MPSNPPLWFALILAMLGDIHTRLEKLMSDQDTLNTFATNLQAAVTAVDAELKALKDQVAAAGHPLDFTAADTALANLQALQPPAAPAEAPATDPNAPAPTA